MEILIKGIRIIGELRTEIYYTDQFYNTLQMGFLGNFLHIVLPKEALEWAKKENLLTRKNEGEVIFEKNGNNIKIYSCPDYEPDDLIDDIFEHSLANSFQTTIDKFVKLIKDWEEVISKKPSIITIKRENGDFTIESETFEMRKTNIKLNDTTIKNINDSFLPKIKDGLFNGGFILKNDNFIKTNCDQTDTLDICSANINFNDDYTFNHSMFPEKVGQDEIKNKLIKYTEPDSIQISKNFFDIETKQTFCLIFFIFGTLTKVFVNKNMEIIGLYPVFGRKQ